MKLVLAVLTLLATPTLSAHAQDAPAPQPVPQTDVSGSGDLSHKLDKTNGVIHPATDVDPKIAKPAPVPDPNSTIVITPPGTAGTPGPQPK